MNISCNSFKEGEISIYRNYYCDANIFIFLIYISITEPRVQVVQQRCDLMGKRLMYTDFGIVQLLSGSVIVFFVPKDILCFGMNHRAITQCLKSQNIQLSSSISPASSQSICIVLNLRRYQAQKTPQQKLSRTKAK